MFRKSNQKKGASELPATKPVAYFCAEYGITDALPIYSGGLGVLAGDITQESAEQNLPFIPIGLFYKRGYFHQFVDCGGQKESTSETIPSEVPLKLLTNNKKETVLLEIPIAERIVFAQVWQFTLANDNVLFLLDTDHWKNNDQDKNITDQLYGGDQQKRIEQELVLAIGGSRLLDYLGVEISVYHMNEGHSAFLALELIRKELLTNKDLGFEKA